MRRLALATIAALLLALGHHVPASADGAGGWYDGRIGYTDVVNCTSLIQGAPYSEKGIGAYTGYWADPDSGKPAVGDTFWIHYSVYGLGQPCSGGTYFRPTITLPPGVSFDTTQQIRCAYDGSGGPAPQTACPGWSNMSSGTYSNNQNDGLWGVAQGHNWEFQFPVRATQPLSGSTLNIALATADGNNNATVPLQAPIYVFPGNGQTDAGPQVLYDNPSTVNATTNPGGSGNYYGFYSAFQAIVNGVAGNLRLELGTSQATEWWYDFAIPAGSGSSLLIWTDWYEPDYFPQLAPGTTYYWRGAFTPTGGQTTFGAWQSFTTNGSSTAVTASEPVATTAGGSPGGLSGGGTLGGTLTPVNPPSTAPAKATATVTAKAKGRIVSTRRGKVAVWVTSTRRVTGTVTIREKGRVLGRRTLANGSTVVTLNRKLRAGRHTLTVTYSGSSVTNPASRVLRVVVRRR